MNLSKQHFNELCQLADCIDKCEYNKSRNCVAWILIDPFKRKLLEVKYTNAEKRMKWKKQNQILEI